MKVPRRGEIWWADLPDPVGSGPGYRRPVLDKSLLSAKAGRLLQTKLGEVEDGLRLVLEL